MAVVDQGWLNQLDGAQPHEPPQSHLVNARTNSSWDKQLRSGRRVRGYVEWYGPVRLVHVGKQPPDDVRTFHKEGIIAVIMLVLLPLLLIFVTVKRNWANCCKFLGQMGNRGRRNEELSPVLELPPGQIRP